MNQILEDTSAARIEAHAEITESVAKIALLIGVSVGLIVAGIMAVIVR